MVSDRVKHIFIRYAILLLRLLVLVIIIIIINIINNTV
ncbi:unnamed protein product [Schistosoma curassoni]|uniref:Small membrane protein n=1 Tax=Schistosoma curassoni TaxID=6186 RepID=A0A183JE51_9TREM|nr:unnamed protein product [Schistosoma curassoni]